MHTYSGGANAAVQRCKGASSVIAIAEDQALVQSGSFRFTSFHVWEPPRPLARACDNGEPPFSDFPQ